MAIFILSETLISLISKGSNAGSLVEQPKTNDNRIIYNNNLDK